MQEIIDSISVIKMYCWESFLLKKVIKYRKSESQLLKKRSHLIGVLQILFFVSPYIICMFTLIVSLYIDNISKFESSNIFMIVTFSSQIGYYISEFTRAIYTLVECMNGHDRIKKFLLLPEHDVKLQKSREIQQHSDLNFDEVIFFNYFASYPKTNISFIKNLNFNMKPGMMLGVIGPVGSGKSTLLKILVDELAGDSGQKYHPNSISISTQETWIFAGTIKENIILGTSLEMNRYEEVLKAASLLVDIENFPSGDETLLGPKGITLSGGQKARVGLARLMYKRSDLYILDDPFAAVDVKVAQQIRNSCIDGFLDGKSRIVITHQFQYLSNADRILFLNNGEQLFFGSFDEIMATNNQYIRTLIKSNQRNHTEEKPLTEACGGVLELKKSQKSNERENRFEGSINTSDIVLFFRASGSDVFLMLYIIIQLSSNAIFVASDIMLSKFADAGESQNKLCAAPANSTNSDACDKIQIKHVSVANSFVSYSIILTCALATALISGLMFFTICIKSSRNVHNVALASVIQTKMAFFSINPMGRILNRFSQDIGRIDELFPFILDDTLRLGFQAFGSIIIGLWANWFNVVLLVPMIILLFILRYYYLKTSREIKRLESVLRSPLYSHVSDTVGGRLCIRTFEMETKVIERFYEIIDNHCGAHLLFCATHRWLAFRVDMLIAVYITIFAISLVPLSKNETVVSIIGLSPAKIGLALSTACPLLYNLQHCIRQSAEVENHLTSVERILEYAKLPSETSSLTEHPKKKVIFNKDTAEKKLNSILNIEIDKTPAPEKVETDKFDRELRFENFNFNYHDDDPLVLKNINLHVKSGEKIGIVGRTGSGKSSLIAALFRVKKGLSGTISINGRDVDTIPLQKVRKLLSIIPQNPVIFSDSVRVNLDPHGNFVDEKIWDALRQVDLKDYIADTNGTLDHVLHNQGEELSVGQKQLICLARALLNRKKILLIDEATANVDIRTDEFIQKTIRKEFSDCTILTIAHRLETIVDCDRIIVMEKGEVAAFDTPSNLIRDKQPAFAHMMKPSHNT